MIYEAIDRWNDPNAYLEHFGVKGMKWGVRHEPRSLSGRFHRILAANNRLNAKTYRKLGNKTLASMNEAAANQQLKKAEAADARKREKIREKSNKHSSKANASRIKEFGSSLKNAKNKTVNFVKEHKKEIAIGAGIVGGVALAYGAYKVHNIRRNNMISVGKYVSDHGVLPGNYVTGHNTSFTPDGNKVRYISRENASIKNSILGPTLTREHRDTTLYRGSTIGNKGEVIPNSGKIQRVSSSFKDIIGRNGDSRSVPKSKDKRFRKSMEDMYINKYKLANKSWRR